MSEFKRVQKLLWLTVICLAFSTVCQVLSWYHVPPPWDW